MFDWIKPTVQIIGNFDYWTEEIEFSILEAVNTVGQVLIVITKTSDDEDEMKEKESQIINNLNEKELYMHQHYQIIHLPNIVKIIHTENRL